MDVHRPATREDGGLLVLRAGAGLALALLFGWGGFPSAGVAGITGHRAAVAAVAALGLLAACGLLTRVAAVILSAAMLWAAASGLRLGQDPLEEPVRALVFAILYGALALTGPGTWSLDRLIRRDSAHGARPPASRVANDGHRATRLDLGLLVLRAGTGLSLFAFFGITKIGWLIALLRTPGAWQTWSFPKLIGAVGLPAPVVLAFFAIANETVIALLVAIGLATRWTAAVAAVGMTGALYTSLRISEEPVRALVYVVAFATIALAGPGRYSADSLARGRARVPDGDEVRNGVTGVPV